MIDVRAATVEGMKLQYCPPARVRRFCCCTATPKLLACGDR